MSRVKVILRNWYLRETARKIILKITLFHFFIDWTILYHRYFINQKYFISTLNNSFKREIVFFFRFISESIIKYNFNEVTFLGFLSNNYPIDPNNYVNILQLLQFLNYYQLISSCPLHKSKKLPTYSVIIRQPGLVEKVQSPRSLYRGEKKRNRPRRVWNVNTPWCALLSPTRW